ncbi:hypothetical protein RCG23_00425 [Neobacillus sp. PS3-34]|uniref:hypothetical protein n=1 Tax=Neobacillus sp. PS3-34 TaxID=3070678 RepID=UPI0027E0EAC5|nr:hypothetical protein [Neobacillus sp. PS3-34]WML48656.1 hypothetical protein RCG23_00425 [Neobacillus sp. PS3-34]
MKNDYKDNDDLQLYDSVVESLGINHKEKKISFYILKVIESIYKSETSFTYKVRKGILEFSGVVYADIPYFIEFDEWNEFYRSAILKSSSLIDQLPERSKLNKNLTHIYLGIDVGNEFSKKDIVCEEYNLSVEDQDYILHDDFDWLYEE